MFWTKERLERWKDGSTILSLLAVPVLLAIGGWLIQQRTADEAGKKEYVQIAVTILREKPDPDNAQSQELRQWAISIVDRFAPIKLSREGRDALLRERLATWDGGTWDGATWDGVTFDSLPGTFSDPGLHCARYYIITDDKEGFDNCVKRLREKQSK
jgi:hypothetical protein